jgi:sugar fermentation stimulation protein A
MIHFNNLQEGILIKRYKRFLADVLLKENNEVVTCHCPNSGSMLGVNQEGLTVYVAKKNKYQITIFFRVSKSRKYFSCN